jgi:competence protein ComEA
MNRKEKFAAAILVATLGIGVAVDVFDGGPASEWTDGAGSGDSAAVAGVDSAVGAESLQAEGIGALGVPGGGTGGSGSGANGYNRIDINRAGVEELMLLPGIGPKKAASVLEWRAAHGRFASVDGLLEVRGIGRSTLERLRPYATAGE